MPATFTLFDLIFIAFTIIFIVTAFVRGFVKEIFSLLNWVVALAASYLAAPFVDKFLYSYVHNKLLVGISVRAGLFILILVVMSLLTSGMRKSLQDKVPESFNKSLGILYGFGKTLLIFGLFYAVMANSYSSLLGSEAKENSQNVPKWLAESKSVNLIKISADILNPLVGKVIDSVMVNVDKSVVKPKNLDDKIDQVIEEKIAAEAKKLEKDENQDQLDKQDLGYSKKDLEKMNHLIEIINK